MISQRVPRDAFLWQNLRVSSGFSLIELLFVVMIVGILAGIAIPNYAGQVRDHRLTQYTGEAEYLVKYARILAMEKTTNVGVCVNGNRLVLNDVGTDRTAAACSGSLLMGMSVTGTELSSMGLTVSGTSVTIDPRGIAINPVNGGSVQLSNGTKFRRVTIGIAGTQMQEGYHGST